MILSHKHRFIFLKTSKTAGSSIEIALSRLCGPDDVVTPMTPSDEVLRREHGGTEPRNFRRFLKSFQWKDLPIYWAKRRLPAYYYNHMLASEVKGRVEPEVWASYYKFCFERNPWDRVVSYYYWLYRKGGRPEFHQFLGNDANLWALKARGWEIYTIGQRIAVDKVCHFERMTEELQVVYDSLGMGTVGEIPRAKVGFRDKKVPYREMYKEHEAARVGAFFADEISLMGYDF